VLRFWFSLTLAGLLFAIAFPLIVFRPFLAGFGSADASVLPHLRRRQRAADFDQQRLWALDEFGFEHALQAYEELIDAHVSTPRTKARPWGSWWRPK